MDINIQLYMKKYNKVNLYIKEAREKSNRMAKKLLGEYMNSSYILLKLKCT